MINHRRFVALSNRSISTIRTSHRYRARLSCQATDEVTSDNRIKKAMSSLDALLGVVDEPPKASEAPKAEPMESSISKVALDKLAEAESARNATKLSSTSSPSSTSQPESALDDQFRRIVARAKKLANEKEGGAGGSLEKEQAALKKEFDDMLKKLSTEASETLNKEQLKQLKEAAFGPLSFWITETKPIQVGCSSLCSYHIPHYSPSPG